MSSLRAALNSPVARAVAIVASLSALGGAVAGGVAALIAAAVLTPSEPVTIAQIASLALGYGLSAALGGALLATAIGFGALRRVPLGRLIIYPNLGLLAGLTAGWLGGPWAWHHMSSLAVVGFAAGAVVARVRTRGNGAPSLPQPDGVGTPTIVPHAPDPELPGSTITGAASVPRLDRSPSKQ